MTGVVVPRVLTDKEPAGSRKWLMNYSEAAYHSDREAVSQGALLEMANSPEHFITRWSKPYDPAASTPAQFIGKTVHLAVLEPARYAKRIIRPHFGDGRTTKAKEAKQAWLDDLPDDAVVLDADGKRTGTAAGAIVLTPEEAQQIEGMALSVLSKPKFKKLMSEAITEVTTMWADEQTGIYCRARLDVVSAYGGKTIIDLKTTDRAMPEEVSRTINNYRYHFQAAHYLAAGNAVEPGAFDRYVLGFIEKEPPYGCRLYLLNDRAIAKGAAMRAGCLATLRHCIETDRWPGYTDEIDVVDLPSYAYNAAPVEF